MSSTTNDAEYSFLSLFVGGDGTIQDKRYAFYTGVLDGSISVGGISGEEADEKFVQKVSSPYRVYATGSQGDINLAFSSSAVGDTVAVRTTGGQIVTSVPRVSTHAVQKAQLDALAARVLALETPA